jgi:hypothetical protein
MANTNPTEYPINPDWENATYGIEMTHPQVPLNNNQRFAQMVQERLAEQAAMRNRDGLQVERELTATMLQMEAERIRQRAQVSELFNNVPPYRDWLAEESKNEPEPRHPSEFPCA